MSRVTDTVDLQVHVWSTEGFAMGQAIVVRTDFTSEEVRQLLHDLRYGQSAEPALDQVLVTDCHKLDFRRPHRMQ